MQILNVRHMYVLAWLRLTITYKRVQAALNTTAAPIVANPNKALLSPKSVDAPLEESLPAELEPEALALFPPAGAVGVKVEVALERQELAATLAAETDVGA